eukprot:Skav229280  [mRNA]  locus=scaffold952:359005:360731:- [translate_table: standard]
MAGVRDAQSKWCWAFSNCCRIRSGAMSQLSPAAEPFSNLADGAVLHLNAQYQAEIASKCATELATYIQSLWSTVMHLEHKVQQLEDWKKKALEDVKKLRDEHKTLRRKVMGEEPVELGAKPAQSDPWKTLQ